MTSLICGLDTTERLRERILSNGGAALADSELLATVLRTGNAGRSALDVARELLRERSGVAGLVGVYRSASWRSLSSSSAALESSGSISRAF